MTAYVSVLTITAFTIERYVAICYPLKAHKFADLKRSIKIIIAIWIVAFFCALPYPIHTRTYYYLHDGDGASILDSLQCNIPPFWVSRMRIVFQISTILFFVFPMTLITVLYIMIALALRKTTLKRSCSEESRGYSSCHSIKAVLRMLGERTINFMHFWRKTEKNSPSSRELCFIHINLICIDTELNSECLFNATRIFIYFITELWRSNCRFHHV